MSASQSDARVWWPLIYSLAARSSSVVSLAGPPTRCCLKITRSLPPSRTLCIRPGLSVWPSASRIVQNVVDECVVCLSFVRRRHVAIYLHCKRHSSINDSLVLFTRLLFTRAATQMLQLTAKYSILSRWPSDSQRTVVLPCELRLHALCYITEQMIHLRPTKRAFHDTSARTIRTCWMSIMLNYLFTTLKLKTPQRLCCAYTCLPFWAFLGQLTHKLSFRKSSHTFWRDVD